MNMKQVLAPLCSAGAIALVLIGCGHRKEPPVVSGPLPQALVEHSAEFTRTVIKVTDGVYVAIGFALANSIMLEGSDGVVIVDTTETLEAASKILTEFRKITDKPVKAIIYTHSHPDHVGGAAAFIPPGASIPIYAQEGVAQNMDKVASELRAVITTRSLRMYGGPLTPDERINLGIGGFLDYHEGSTVEALRPTQTFKDRLDVTIAGLHLQLVHAPGETDDQLFVWLPDLKVLLCGDNFYKAFPNLYTIRGTSYRDPKLWATSLDKMRALQPDFLVPSHTKPLSGNVEIERALTDYRDAIRYVYDQTVRMMNQGLLPDQIASKLQLPKQLAASPYLQEFYGKPSWAAKSIFAGTLGWYSGDATDLQPLEPTDQAQRMVDLAGGSEALDKKIKAAIDKKDWQWALQLTGYALRASPSDDSARDRRMVALRALAANESNQPARDWYFTAARELEGTKLSINQIKPTKQMLASMPMSVFFDGMAVNLHAEDCVDRVIRVGLTFSDSGERYTYIIRNGVSEVIPGIGKNLDIDTTVTAQTFKEMLAGLRNPLATIATSFQMNKGNKLDLANFLALFSPPADVIPEFRMS